MKDGHSFTNTKQEAARNACSGNCLRGAWLSVTCLILACVILLLVVYDHKNSLTPITQPGVYSLEVGLRLSSSEKLRLVAFPSVNVSGKDTLLIHDIHQTGILDRRVVLPDENTELKNDKLTTDSRKDKTAMNGTHVNVKLMEPVHVEYVNDKSEGKENSTSPPTLPPPESPPYMNGTHVNGKLMEPVHVEYVRNVYFTVKTTNKYYKRRLLPLLLTWFQVVDKDKLSIVSDRSDAGTIYVDAIRSAGFHILDTNCSSAYSYTGLGCKLGTEFAAYYEAVEKHPGEEDRYQWFCHSDDDVYVNVPQLSHFLQQYDSNKPYYFGRWPGAQRGGAHDVGLSNQTAYHIGHEMNYTLKQMAFRYATGAICCISRAIMMEAKKFFNGQSAFYETYTLAHLPDDMTAGLVIGILLGYNLTEVTDMKNQYDNLQSSSLKQLANYLSVGGKSLAYVTSLQQFAVSIRKPPLYDSQKFSVYHCFLYPTVSWCQR